MELSSVITGAIVTEKAEQAKMGRTYTITVHPDATKVDVKNALRTHWNVDAGKVRSMRTPQKTRAIARGRKAVKRARTKKMLVTLTRDSKTFDITAFTS